MQVKTSKTKYKDFYCIRDAHAALKFVQNKGGKGYVQTMSSCRYQLRWWVDMQCWPSE